MHPSIKARLKKMWHWGNLVPLLLTCCAPLSGGCQQPSAQSVRAELEAAAAAQNNGHYSEAEALYRKLLRTHPNLLPARANLGLTLAAEGRYREAIPELKAAQRLAPQNRSLGFYLGMAFLKERNLAAAARQFELLHKSNPADRKTTELLGFCWAHSGQAQRAVSLLKPLAGNSPDMHLKWALADAYAQAGASALAAPLTEEVAQANRNAKLYLLASRQFITAGSFERAERDLQTAASIDPTLPGLDLLRGTLQAESGENPAAERTLRSVIQHDPASYDAHLELGLVLLNMGKFQQAEQEARWALQRRPNDPRALFEEGKLQAHFGHPHAAIQSLTAAVRKEPQWLDPHVLLAALYYRVGNAAAGARERTIVNKLSAAQKQRPS